MAKSRPQGSAFTEMFGTSFLGISSDCPKENAHHTPPPVKGNANYRPENIVHPGFGSSPSLPEQYSHLTRRTPWFKEKIERFLGTLIVRLQRMSRARPSEALRRRATTIQRNGDLRTECPDWWQAVSVELPPTSQIGEVWSGIVDWITNDAMDWKLERVYSTSASAAIL
jgi:hypothetical protein